jgi:hypothetical protein
MEGPIARKAELPIRFPSDLLSECFPLLVTTEFVPVAHPFSSQISLLFKI